MDFVYSAYSKNRLDKVTYEGEFEIVVPDGVKAIGNHAFGDCTEVVRVVLPDSVEEIDGWAFAGCKALEEVELGTGVKNIGFCAFSGCEALKSVSMPAKMKSWASEIFSGCVSLKEIVVPEGITKLVSAFLKCSALERVVLPEGLTEVGYNAFSGCSALKEISLPEGLNVIGPHAFRDCTALTELVIPRSVTIIGERAFEGCSVPVIEKDGLKYIGGDHVLYGTANAKTKVVIPENVTVMMYGAFAGCKYLTEVTVSENLKKISDNAFMDCTALKTVHLPGGMKVIGSGAFSNCRKLTEITLDVEQIGSAAFYKCAALRKVVLEEGVKEIYDGAFGECPKLSEIQLPSTLVRVQRSVFKGCAALKRLVFREGLEELEASAFLECTGMEEVYIPASVTKLSVNYWSRPKESANLRYVEIAGAVDLEKRESYQTRGHGVWNLIKLLDTAGVCLKDMPVDDIPAAVRKRAVIGFACGVARGVAFDEAIAQGYMAYIKKNKTKLAEDAAANPDLLRLMMREKFLAADKIEMVIKGLGGNQELIAEVTAYRDSAFSAADKAKTKAKAKAGDDARAQRLADADAGKGGLTFVSAVDFDYWQHGGEGRYFYDKDELEQFLGRRGMKLSAAAPTGKTDFLIVSNKIYETTSKMEKAKKLGVPFITEAELLAKENVWKEVDNSLSADGKTYTFDASAEFAHEMLTNGKIPDTVETINLSVVAINRGNQAGDAVPAEVSKKIRFTDLKRTGIDYSQIAEYIYTKIGRDTLEEYFALMGKEKYYEVLPKIFARYCNPINDETEVSEEALEGLELTALGREIVNVMHAFLIGGHEYTLTYAETGNPVSEKVLIVLMMSLAYRWVHRETKRGGYTLVNAWESIGSKETALFGLMNRAQLRKMLSDIFPMYDGMEHVDKEVARAAAIKLCGVDAAKGMMATVRELERKQSGFGISQVRYDLMNGIRAKLGASEDRDVLMYLDKVKHLDWAASARGVKEEELRAELLASAELGLDEESGLTLDYGARQIRAQLSTDLTFSFVDLSKNKTMRALPKAAKTDDAEKVSAAQEEFKRVRELIKTISVIYLNKIKEMYYQGTSMKKSKWDEMYMSRQVSLRMAHGVLWGVFDKDDTLKTAFCVKGSACFDVDGNEISIPKSALIGVVDLAQLDPVDRAAWRKYFSQDEIPQPVKQVWQPLCMISIKDVEKRYKGCHIAEGTLQGLGWEIYAEDGQDPSVHSEYITAEIDYWSRHGMIYGTGNVDKVTVHIDHDIAGMTDHEKRLWNQSVQKLDYYLKPQSKAEDAIRSGDVSQVREWVEAGLISADNLTEMIEVSTAASQTVVTAYLLSLSQDLRAEDEDDEWAL